jgi:transcriptional regulator with GAF, ATPase, and Fis domain
MADPVRSSRESSVTAAFIAIADNLVGEFDLADLLGGLVADCTRLLDIEDAGLLLADSTGMLQVVAATSEQLRGLEQLELDSHEGPCVECFDRGAPVEVADLREMPVRWPTFAAAAQSAGYRSVHALPLRVLDHTLGCLGLFARSTGTLGADDFKLAQALAHTSSITLIVHEAMDTQERVTSQLQTALSSRVVLEQAKGVISESGELDMDGAFEVLRRYSRNHNMKLTALAQAVANRTLPAQLVLEEPPPPARARRPSGVRSGVHADGAPTPPGATAPAPPPTRTASPE